MMCVTTTGDPATEPARIGLDRPVLVGNLVAGAVWLLPLALPWALNSLPLFLIGAVYVLAGSVFLAAVYARPVLARKQEALAWIASWLVAVALWMAIGVSIQFENTMSHYLVSLFLGLSIATPCYLLWQILALVVRQLVAWRSGRSSLPT